MTPFKLRVRFATMLLRWAGAAVDYRVKRLRPPKPHIVDDIDQLASENVHKDGTTVQRSEKLKDARRRLHAMRCGDADKLSIQLVATVEAREKKNVD